ncbi:MAG: hypothetical protein P8X68_08275 [Desulfobacterales bacterium]
MKKGIDINIHVPTADNPPTGKPVVFGTAELKIDRATNPWAPNRFVIEFFNQFN